MGGYGSGQRAIRKDLVSDYLCLDINTFRRRGRWRFLIGVSTWSRGSVKTASIGYTVMDKIINLSWRDSENHINEQSIPLVIVQVKYGLRFYFSCPRCGRRVTKLYAGRDFYCRHCYQLTYESARDSHSSYHARLALSDKQYRNFFKAIAYSRELKEKKWVRGRMLRRLNRYVEKSGIIF